MKVLIIGGTGTISTSCSRLAVERGMDVTLLNRGQRDVTIEGARHIEADIYDPASVNKALGGETFDVVANFINFKVPAIERDLELFAGRTKQYFFISSASVYQKPLENHVVTESTPLKNPYWQYSRDKIACEERLMRAYREDDFPGVIVRPSYTYNERLFALSLGGGHHYTIVDRMRKGKKIVIHGDGTSLWTNTHADDFAKGFVGLFGNRRAIGESFHITSDEVLDWNQIYRALADAAGVTADIVHVSTDQIIKAVPSEEGPLWGDKAWSAIMDNSKIKRFVPDFQATIPFREGVRRALEWFEADSERMVIDKGTNEQIDAILATLGEA